MALWTDECGSVSVENFVVLMPGLDWGGLRCNDTDQQPKTETSGSMALKALLSSAMLAWQAFEKWSIFQGEGGLGGPWNDLFRG